jgi:hypothetical protein
MLFNLSCSKHFLNTGKGGILCGQSYGPCFTPNAYGYSELGAYDEPFNGEGKCYSYANQPGYRIPCDAAGVN